MLKQMKVLMFSWGTLSISNSSQTLKRVSISVFLIEANTGVACGICKSCLSCFVFCGRTAKDGGEVINKTPVSC